MALCMAWIMDTANALRRRIHGIVCQVAEHKNILGLVEYCNQYCSIWNPDTCFPKLSKDILDEKQR